MTVPQNGIFQKIGCKGTTNNLNVQELNEKNRLCWYKKIFYL